jgi:hypothetical protein
MDSEQQPRPVTVSFTVQEANELVECARKGIPDTFVNRGLVEATCERIDAATRAAEEGGAT